MSKLLALLMSLFLACAPMPTVAQEPVSAPMAPPAAAAPAEAYDGIFHVRFWGDIGPGSGLKFMSLMQKAEAEKPDVIVIELNTTGGNVDEGFMMAKAIEDADVPVMCIVDYEALSMGFYILQSCPVRLMTTRSRLMVHDPGLMLSAQRMTPAAARAWLAQVGALADAMDHHWSKRMKMDLPTFKRTMRAKGDWWMTAEEAKKLGAVDDSIDSAKDFVNGLKRAHRLRKALKRLQAPDAMAFPLPFPVQPPDAGSP